jgi:hypothetical protein
MKPTSWIQRKLWDFAAAVVLLGFVALAWGWLNGGQWVELAKWFGGYIAAAVGVPATAGAVTTAVSKLREPRT